MEEEEGGGEGTELLKYRGNWGGPKLESVFPGGGGGEGEGATLTSNIYNVFFLCDISLIRNTSNGLVSHFM